MTKKMYDISRKLNTDLYVWPGIRNFSLDTVFSQQVGDSVNVSDLVMGIHTGTHVDAPFHFDSEGETVEQLPLHVFWGQAQVITIDKPEGALLPEDIAQDDLSLAPRLLLHTQASDLPDNIFPERIVYPSPVLAAYLAQAGIILLGTDAPSMDAVSDKTLAGHHALYQNGIAILEGVNLTGVPDGIYELAALPLNIEAGDGSPVRAVLRSP